MADLFAPETKASAAVNTARALVPQLVRSALQKRDTSRSGQITLSPQTRSNTDPLLDSFAIRTFRDMADGDYIMARSAYKNRLVPQFLTASHQAIEKYIKCILLIHRIKSRNIGHSLARGLQKMSEIKSFEVNLSKRSRDFIGYLDRHEKIRYFEYSYYVFGPALIDLDRTVWEVRQYCHRLDYSLRTLDGREIPMLQKELARIAQFQRNPHKYRLQGGSLEKIIDDSANPARKTLIWKNAFFGDRTKRNLKLLCLSYSGNSPLYLHPEILPEISEYVFIPPEVKKIYEKYLILSKKKEPSEGRELPEIKR